MSLKKDLIKHLSLISDLLEFKGANKFKVSAFKNASNVVRRVEGNLDEMIQDGSISEVKGIGKGIQKVIMEFTESGSSKDLNDLEADVPEGITELFGIRGIGAGKIRVLHRELNVNNTEDLEKRCQTGEVAQLKGFGSKLQNKIQDEIKLIKRSKGFMLLHKALSLCEEVKKELQEIEVCSRVEFTGKLRRRSEVIDNLEFVVVINEYKRNYKELANFLKINILDKTSSYIKIEVLDVTAHPVIVYCTDEKLFTYVWFLTTASEEYLDSIKEHLVEEHYDDEYELARKIGIKLIIPEMREGAYIDAPEKLRSDSNLTFSSFNGFLHFHTTKSDGQNTLAEMVKAADMAGFKYCAVCDHSKSAFYANGLTEERILLQQKEIAEVNLDSIIPIFHGIESDILRDGSLDYKDEVLESFSFIVASVHSIFNLSEDEMTDRMIRAIENPYTDVLAHPTGRLLLSREGYNVNIEKIIDACSENDVAIEVNANPFRLDLDWRNIYYAREKGCKFAINPDAHSVEGILDTSYGIMIARKGGMQTDEVINCFSLAQFKNYLNRKVKRII